MRFICGLTANQRCFHNIFHTHLMYTSTTIRPKVCQFPCIKMSHILLCLKHLIKNIWRSKKTTELSYLHNYSNTIIGHEDTFLLNLINTVQYLKRFKIVKFRHSVKFLKVILLKNHIGILCSVSKPAKILS